MQVFWLIFEEFCRIAGICDGLHSIQNLDIEHLGSLLTRQPCLILGHFVDFIRRNALFCGIVVRCFNALLDSVEHINGFPHIVGIATGACRRLMHHQIGIFRHFAFISCEKNLCGDTAAIAVDHRRGFPFAALNHAGNGHPREYVSAAAVDIDGQILIRHGIQLLLYAIRPIVSGPRIIPILQRTAQVITNNITGDIHLSACVCLIFDFQPFVFTHVVSPPFELSLCTPICAAAYAAPISASGT